MPSPSLSATQKDNLNRILSEAVSSKSTTAMFFGVTTADGTLYMHQEGKKFVDDPMSEPIDEDTVFWLCSQMKLITTIAALQLVDQGKIALDTPVETVMPELANPVVITGKDKAGNPLTTPAKNKITFGQLLNHTSGLDGGALHKSRENGIPDMYLLGDQDVSAVFKHLKGSLPNVPLKFEPGTDFAYGHSTDCAGFIVERISGKSLEQYFQDHIFAPLGITSASFYLTPPLKDRLLPLSYRTKSGVIERWKGSPVIDLNPAHVRVHFGGGNLYASQKDYLVLLHHILQIKGAFTGTATTPILTRASVNSLFSPTLPPAGAKTLDAFMPWSDPYFGVPAGGAQFSHGLFVNTVDVPGRRKSGSGAWGGWANTNFFIDPTTGVAVVFATQLAPRFDDTHHRLYDTLEKTLYAGLA
ncbi:beta-lactamase/transpeptidase-like protein [Mycena metata]|uniref:Beta-lactamase/transpeptidase-like protein n=1 Tax=Mycena metata TaxID=1033252 RepID=A0AAD7NIL2_9AGAR|nr:beta-lactamase/transpeptidase-like protein [Mycena metata]